MNLKECKDEVLKLIERYSVAGQAVALSYNGQSDYLLRMNGLVNDAVMTIATVVKKIDATYQFTRIADSSDTWVTYTLPTDFYQRANGGGITVGGEKLKPGTDYKWVASNKFLLKSSIGGAIYVDYYRYPEEVSTDSTELDNTPDTHIAVPYYVASMLVQQDNPYLAATLYNIYETKISRLEDDVEVTIEPIDDVYGFGGW